ncbi:radical SAM protein [Bdellovibrionota bacterium FG-2]
MQPTPNETTEVLMINPPWISKDENIWHGVKSAMPPLGLLSVAAYIESKGHKVAVIDVHVEKLSVAQLSKQILAAQPRIVGISVMTATANAANQIARIVKETVPGCLVVFGGVHPEAVPAETLCNSAVDVVVRGDGEEPFLSLVRNEPFGTISGISFRQGLNVIHNPCATVDSNLDQYPFPAYHLVPMEKYYPAIGAYKHLPAINMLMTRGCPGKCTFCNSARTAVRTRSAEHVVEEIKHLKKTYGIREIQFYDDTFTVVKKNVLKFCELMETANLGVSWVAFVRADCFSEEMARAMKRAGCHQVLIGVESGDEQILRNIKKPIEFDRIRATIEIARRVGIDSRAAFIFGNQGETTESMQKTIDFSMELDPDIALYNICTPYPGTQLFHWAKTNNFLLSEEWSDFELSTPIMQLPTVSREQIERFYSQAHRQYYLRPIAVWRRITKISRFSHIRDLFLAFCYIVLRWKLGARGEVKRDWMGFKKQDFFDLTVSAERPPALTFEVRAQGTKLDQETLSQNPD